METNQPMGPSCANCKCPHHKMVSVFIVLIGLTVLLKNLSVLSMGAADVIWPSLLILIGLQKMFGGMCKCCKKS